MSDPNENIKKLPPLTREEGEVMKELNRIAGREGITTAKQLRDEHFAEFVCEVYKKDVGYPGSLQSRVLQELRNKGYIEMDNGKYLLQGITSY